MSQEKFFLTKAKRMLKEHFITQRKEPRTSVFYQSQLQIFYEKDFYPWVVSDALKELVSEGYLKKITEKEIQDFKDLGNLNKINFFVNAIIVKSKEGLEKAQKKAAKTAKIVNEYSDAEHSKMLGDYLESLVKQELRAQQFTIVSERSNEFNGKKWTKTKHNLDFIAVHKDGKLKVGVEVKNTLSIMPPDEIDVKVEICEYLGLVPVFANRWLKPYLYCISNQGGFCWMFKVQCYPLGFEKYTKFLYNKLSDLIKKDSVGHELKFPINVRKELPEKSIEIFKDWVEDHKDNPPEVNSSQDRCGHKT